MTYKDKHWDTLDIARGYSKFFNGSKIYKTTRGFVVLTCHEKKKFKSWKLIENTCKVQ